MRGGLAILGAVSLTCLAPRPGAASTRSFRHYTVADGLTHTIVDHLAQGPEGRLWLATQFGVSVFDGESFEALHESDGLGDERVRRVLVEGPDVWIGTDSTLQRWRDGRFIETFPIGALALARRRGVLYVGNQKGLWTLDGQRLERDERVHEAVTDLVIGPEERAWIGTNRGLMVLGDGATRIGGDGVVDIETGPRGELLVSFGNRVERRGPDGGFYPIPGLSFAPRVVIQTMFFSTDGTLWLGTDQGLASFDDGDLAWMTQEDGLPVSPVSTILESEDGQLWLGGQQGLAVLASRAFEHYGRGDGLRSEVVRPILRDEKGRLWAGTTDGLAVLENGGIRLMDQADGLPRGRITDLLEEDGELWVGTGHGLARGGPKGFREVSSWPDGHGVLELERGPDGDLWVSDYEGLYRLGANGRAEIRAPEQSLAQARIAIGSQEVRWLGGQKGLSRYRAGEWTTWTTADGLADDEVYMVAVAPDGAVWFSYRRGRGVSRFDGASFRTWTVEDGLASSAVYSIGFDREGRVWLGSARGVDVFDGERFRNYGPPEGYPSYESNAGGFWLDHDGSLWFGTNGGLAHYRPWLDRPLPAPPELQVALLGRDTGRPIAASVEVRSLLPRERIQLHYGVDDEAWQSTEVRRLPLSGLGPGPHSLRFRARVYNGDWSPVSQLSFFVPRPLHKRFELWALVFLLCLGATIGLLRRRLTVSRRRAQKLEALVEERTQALQRASSHKTAFLARMSHEIRSPMNGVVIAAELLRDTPLDSNQSELVSTLQVSTESVLDVVNDVLDISKIEAGEVEIRVESFELGALFDQLNALFRWRATSKALSLEFHVERPLLLSTDRAKLKQLLINLVGNALKFTDSGGIEVRAWLESGSLVTTVHDTGPGMSPDELKTIFEPYRQGQASADEMSTGLGLWITADFVRRLGGTIDVTSALDLGTKFTLRLPHSPGRIEAGQDVPYPAPRLFVLLVDDDVINRKVGTRLLEKLGHRPTVAASGGEALATVRERPFDAVLMDINLPDMSGLEVTRLLRAEKPELPVIALTAAATAEDEARCRSAGMSHFLTKPVRWESLQAALMAHARPTDDPTPVD